MLTKAQALKKVVFNLKVSFDEAGVSCSETDYAFKAFLIQSLILPASSFALIAAALS